MTHRRVTTSGLPAHWASALINGDTSGLSLCPGDLAEFNEWAAQNPGLLHPASCSDEPFIGRWDGLICEMLTYSYLEKSTTNPTSPTSGGKG